MKNQIRYIAFSLLALFIGACEDEEKYPIPDFTRSSVPVFLQKDTDTGFINFQDLDATTLSFDVDRLGTEAVSSIDVLITFNNSETGTSQTVTQSTVNSFPQTVNLSIDQLISLFPQEFLTRDTLSLGDSFVVGGNVLLADGRYLDGGYSPSVVANDPVFVTYNVACASALNGTYDLTLISGDNGEATSEPGQTIATIAPGYYELSDATMSIFGFPVKYRFTDICGNLIADPESVDYGTQIVIRFNAGTVIDPVSGEITFDIEYIAPSCCGLAGIKTVFKATPK
ncbi:MAG: hypothetical protein WA874_06470 [Chryseosolibacter sp.]